MSDMVAAPCCGSRFKDGDRLAKLDIYEIVDGRVVIDEVQMWHIKCLKPQRIPTINYPDFGRMRIVERMPGT